MALPRILRHCTPDNHSPVFSFCNDAFEASATLTYAELGSVTESLAGCMLRARGRDGAPMLKRGDRVVLVFLPSLDFIVAFIASLRAGLVAVPVYPPDPRNLRLNIGLFTSVCDSCGATVALSHGAYTQAVSLAKLKDSAASFLGRGKEGVKWPELTWLRLDGHTLAGVDLLGEMPVGGGLDAASPSDLAFLQYTSGSTSEPKGVRLTHACLGANMDEITASLRADGSTVVVSWLPQYHDMGLIGSYLSLAACGGRGHYSSPLTFIKRPLAWLQACSKFRATHVQAPNFAYALCARKYRESRGAGCERLDLCALRHCFNAAEPVTAVAIRDFCETFAAHGFNPASMAPGYGLAEHTVFVCVGGDVVVGVERGALEGSSVATVKAQYSLTELTRTTRPELTPDRERALLVSCGPVAPYWTPELAARRGGGPPPPSAHPSGHITVAIAETESGRLVVEDGRVGEVWVSSPSVADGYFNAPELSKAAFGVQLRAPAPLAPGTDLVPWGFSRQAGSDSAHTGDSLPIDDPVSSRPWLRTGDLGFVLDGQLFIAGRLKDMLILRGRNYYPNDVESVVELSEPRRLRPGCTAVFATEGEGAVLACEVRPEVGQEDFAPLAASIRAVVSSDFGIRLRAVLLLRPHGVQKTTSGKVARKWNARAWAALEAAPDTSPWAASKGLVLLLDRARGGEEEEDGEEVGRGASGADAVEPVTPGVERAASPSTPAALTGQHLQGKALLVALCRDVGVALGMEPSSIDTRVSLSHLGFDSLALIQLQGRLASKYGVHVRDDLMFAEETSLVWVVTWAEELRKPAELQTSFPAPGLPRVTAEPLPTAATIAGAGVSPVVVVASSGAPVVTVVQGDTAPPPPVSAGVALQSLDLTGEDFGEVAVVGMRQGGGGSGKRKGPSAFEQNCPCVLWCLGR